MLPPTKPPSLLGVHVPAIVPGCLKGYLGGSWLPEKSSCAKILLMVHMRPTAITLNYSVKTCERIYIYEQSTIHTVHAIPPTSCLLVSEKSSVLPPHMKTLSPMATEAWPHLGRGSYLFSSEGRSIVHHLQTPDCTGLAQEGNWSAGNGRGILQIVQTPSYSAHRVYPRLSLCSTILHTADSTVRLRRMTLSIGKAD